MNKKTLVIGIIIISLIVVLGGMLMHIENEKKQKEEKRQEELEYLVALNFKNTFSNIEEIKLEEFKSEPFYIGGYEGYIRINNGKETASFSFSYLDSQDKIEGYSVVNTNVQKKGITKGKIKVTYTNGKESEI